MKKTAKAFGVHYAAVGRIIKHFGGMRGCKT